MWVMWSLVSVHLDTELVSVQHRCKVFAKRTIGSKNIFDAPMVLLGDEAQGEARSIPHEDSAKLDAR
jgi:hypothetical protein